VILLGLRQRCIFEEPLVGEGNAVAQGNFGLPRKSSYLVAARQFVRRTVWHGDVLTNGAYEADNLADDLHELGNRQVSA